MEPLKWDGKKISKPGIYADLPIEVYHGDCAIGPSISSSGLRKIDQKSPLHYWSGSYLNPDRVLPKDKSYFKIGSAAHHLFLGEKNFKDKFVVHPAEYPDRKSGELKEWRANAGYCKSWMKRVPRGRTVISPQQLYDLTGMAKQLAAHPLVQDGILSGWIEHSLIWQDRETGIWLKARPDCIPLSSNLVNDLKTTADASAVGLMQSLSSNGYHMQLALVGMGMKEVLGREISDHDYSLTWVETSEPYAVSINPVDAEAIFAGRRMIRRAIRTFADCLSKNEWPTYSNDGRTVSLTKWARDQIEFEDKAGLLPADH